MKIARTKIVGFRRVLIGLALASFWCGWISASNASEVSAGRLNNASTIPVLASWFTTGLSQKAKLPSPSRKECQFWQSRVDPTIRLPKKFAIPYSQKEQVKILGQEAIGLPDIDDPANEAPMIRGMVCLLKLEGKQNPSVFIGATSLYSSHIIRDPATVEVAALYELSAIYYGKGDHALAAVLKDSDPKRFQPQTVQRAYGAYREWLNEVVKIGLKEARERGMDPLQGTGIRWYGYGVRPERDKKPKPTPTPTEEANLDRLMPRASPKSRMGSRS